MRYDIFIFMAVLYTCLIDIVFETQSFCHFSQSSGFLIKLLVAESAISARYANIQRKWWMYG